MCLSVHKYVCLWLLVLISTPCGCFCCCCFGYSVKNVVSCLDSRRLSLRMDLMIRACCCKCVWRWLGKCCHTFVMIFYDIAA